MTYQVDDVAISRAVTGERIRLHPLERAAAVRWLHQYEQLSDPKIAERLHIAPYTVLRIRHRINLPALYGAGRNLTTKESTE